MNKPNFEELNLAPEDIAQFSANYLRDSFENDIKHIKHHLRSKGKTIDSSRSHFFSKYKDNRVQVIGAYIELRAKNERYIMTQATIDDIAETVRCINENICVNFNVVKYYENSKPRLDDEDEQEQVGDIKTLAVTFLRVIE